MRSKAKLYQNEFLEFICMLYYLPINLQNQNQNQNQNLCLFDPHLHQCSITMYIIINLVCGSGDHC